VTIAIQVNGKLRSTIEVAYDADQESIQAHALAQDAIQKYVADKEVMRVIFVPGKIINFIVQ
jgi:leucyl-tRNA synthetase